MLNVLIIAAIIGQFMVYDFYVHCVGLVYPPALAPTLDRLQRKAVRKIFSIIGAWRGWKPLLDSRLGVELPDRFILVANHQSLFDIPIVWWLLPERFRIRFIAKSELGFGVPLVSTCLRLQGHALVKRSGSAVQAMKSLERFMRRSRKSGFCPVLFPEGTRSRTGELGPFHTAGFRKIVEADPLPVLVAAIDGGFRMAKLGDAFANLGRSTYTVRLVALLPAPHGKKEILAALETSRNLVTEALGDMRRAELEERPALRSKP